MGVVNTLSNLITHADAKPSTLSSRALAGAHPKRAVSTVEVAAADSDTSTYRFFRLPSSAVVTSLVVFCDAITAGTSFDFGLYLATAADGTAGAAIDVDCFASAVDLSTAITAGTQIRFESAANGGDIANIEKALWQLDGLVNTRTSDPNLYYDIVATANTVGSAAGTISLIVEWIEP